MPIPDAVRRLAGTPGFWADYLFLDDAPNAKYPELADTRVTFDICPGYALTLGLGNHLSYHSLGFVGPARAEPVEIGFDDQAHWHPNALRWEELDLFGRCLALHDAAVVHPGLPVLLLYKFAPVSANTDADAVFPLIEAAWRSVGLFDGRRRDDLIERYDRRHAEFVWTETAAGWEIGQSEEANNRSGWDCYTLRSSGYGDAGEDGFPFAEWNEFVAAAERHYAAAVDPAWLTANGGAAAAIARAAAAGDPTAPAVLADALEEAGWRIPVSWPRAGRGSRHSPGGWSSGCSACRGGRC